MLPVEKAVRNHRLGIVLLSTLVSILLLSSLIVVLQKRAQGNVMILARLEKLHRDAPHKDAVFERLRGLVADVMTGTTEGRPKLNGDVFVIFEGEGYWSVQVQDVEGLVDVYLSPPEILALLPLDADAFAATRASDLAQLQPGERYPTLAASLARFGARVADVQGAVTQSSQTGSLRLASLPRFLRVRAVGLPPGVRENEQVQRTMVWIEKLAADKSGRDSPLESKALLK